ncbi:MAG: cyclase family protein [Chloroflexi bacterium]|nr:cyclase family protein [Chloroflexota bacterium]
MLDQLENLIRESRTFELAQPLKQGIPMHPAHVPFCFSMNKRHHDDVYPNGISSANDIIFASGHSGTHIDAIGHFARDGRFHKGVEALTNQNGQRGLSVYGIETTPPVLRRAVLLDVAAWKDVDVLDPTHAISGDELQKTAGMEGIEIRSGDVVFVRTGWARYWDNPARFIGVTSGTPGPDLGGAEWLLERGASLVGSDTASFELAPGGGVVHSLLLVESGIQIVENLNLEELARERVYSFMLFLSPLKIVGGTASPVTPVAICPGR